MAIERYCKRELWGGMLYALCSKQYAGAWRSPDLERGTWQKGQVGLHKSEEVSDVLQSALEKGQRKSKAREEVSRGVSRPFILQVKHNALAIRFCSSFISFSYVKWLLPFYKWGWASISIR